MIPRSYTKLIRQKLARFPAVGILGPRQCGKTTLAKQLRGLYFDLEIEGEATRLDAEWEKTIGGTRLVILDEAQHAPWVFSRLLGAIDSDRRRLGRFLLLGSVSPALKKSVSESLAGRMGLVQMSPFILPELKVSQLDPLWLRGGYPDGGIQRAAHFPEWQIDYLELLATRDLPNWGLSSKPQQTRRLMRMLAVLHGQALNASQIGSSMALDHKTILKYCDFLEAAFLIRRLQPFFTNMKKRLIKTSRIYWRDSGLLHALMKVDSKEKLFHQPWLGASWEGFVIEQTLATISSMGMHVDEYFFRTSDGHELDLVLDWGDQRWAIEIKLTSNPTTDMIHRLRKTAEMIGATRKILICRITRKIDHNDLLVTNLPGWLRMISASR